MPSSLPASSASNTTSYFLFYKNSEPSYSCFTGCPQEDLFGIKLNGYMGPGYDHRIWCYYDPHGLCLYYTVRFQVWLLDLLIVSFCRMADSFQYQTTSHQTIRTGAPSTHLGPKHAFLPAKLVIWHCWRASVPMLKPLDPGPLDQSSWPQEAHLERRNEPDPT
jgi:hypothetical protein